MPTRHVLVIDDHDLDRRLSALDLEEAGYSVYEAANVAEAIDLLKQRAFDAIVLDIKMPGADGLTFLRGIKNSPKLQTIPIIMLTASDNMDDELQAMADGAVRYIVKPAHREVLVQTVASVLDQARLDG